MKKVTIVDEIIFSLILPKLCVKSLVRFKSVCKSWSFVISNPSFAYEHLSLSQERLDAGNLIITCHPSNYLSATSSSYTTSFCLASLSGLEPTKHFLNLYAKSLCYSSESINGLVCFTSSESINGLVCLYNPRSSISYICNPKIQEIIKLPSVCDQPPQLLDYKLNLIYYSLGYEPFRKEYKVFRIALPTFPEFSNMMACEILTLGSNSWRRIDIDAVMLKDVASISGQGLCVSGAIHWLLRSMTAVLAFDLKDENFRVFPIPDVNTFCLRRLIQIGGCLCLIDIKYVMISNIMELWILKDHKVWIKDTVTIPQNYLGVLLSKPFPIGTVPTGEILLNSGLRPAQIISYDIIRRTFRRVELKNMPSYLPSMIDCDMSVSVCSESLISPKYLIDLSRL